MNRRIQKLGLAAGFVGCSVMITGCEAWEELSAETRGLLSGAGAGITAALIASSMGADDGEAILIGLAAGVAVGLIVYATSERPATKDEQAVIAKQSEEIRTQSDAQVRAELKEQDVLVYRPITPLNEVPQEAQTVAYQAYDPSGQPVGEVVELDKATVVQAREQQSQPTADGRAQVTQIQRRQGTHKAIILDA